MLSVVSVRVQERTQYVVKVLRLRGTTNQPERKRIGDNQTEGTTWTKAGE